MFADRRVDSAPGHPAGRVPHGVQGRAGAGMIRSFSYGGGVQSTAALVLAVEGRIDFPLFLFANVGERAENPRTLAYFEEVAKPYAARMGIELVELRRKRRNGTADDLMDRITRSARSLPFPVRMSNGTPGLRSCTAEFKIRVIERELRRRGASAEHKAVVGLGISVDEIHRARTPEDPRIPLQVREYPLIDLNLRRADCLRIIRASGLPQPERSSCFFCPFHSIDEWRRLKREQPTKFAEAVALERLLNERRAMLGKDEVWLTRHALPLDQVVDDQLVFEGPGMDNCESGYCLV